MSLISKFIRSTLTAVAVAAVLSPAAVLASDGLVVKLLDGSVPINQPDLFASAYSKAWNPSNFCTALRSDLLSSPGNQNLTIDANGGCAASAYGTTSVSGRGTLTAEVEFRTKVTVIGTQQITLYNKTAGYEAVPCQFTDTFVLVARDALSLSEPAVAPKVPALSFAPPTLEASEATETWASPCSDGPDLHPAGIATVIARVVNAAASSVNFPGSALVDALSPYQATIQKDLVGDVYNISVTTGDVDIQVLNTFLLSEFGKPSPVARLGQATAVSSSNGAGTSQSPTAVPSAWGAQPTPAAGAQSAAPNWGVSAPGASTAPGGSLSRGVSSALRPVPQQPAASAPAIATAPSALH